MKGWMLFLILTAIFTSKIILPIIAGVCAVVFLIMTVYFLATGDD